MSDAQRLLLATLEACDALQPLVRALYDSLRGDGTTLKEDQSVFTIADGLVQQLVKQHLLHERVHAVVGEEDSADVDVSAAPYKVDALVVPAQFDALIAAARDALERIRRDRMPVQTQLTAFVDPIDGTREFSSKLGEQCSICIGFATPDGRAYAGVVYRPLTTPPTFAAGCAADRFVVSRLDRAAVPSTALLTSNGGISPYLEALMRELGVARVKAGGCGNKVLMLLERKGAAYIQDRGVSRWDTCAAEAVVTAHGGVLGKLSSLLAAADGASGAAVCEPYTYRQSATNLDFVPGLAALTPYNAVAKVQGAAQATRVEDVKAYANLCGLVAVLAPADINVAACKAAASNAAPEFS